MTTTIRHLTLPSPELRDKRREDLTWKTHAVLEVFPGSGYSSDGKRLSALERTEIDTNLLVRGGASLMWEYAKGNGSTGSTVAKKYLNATCALGVGNSTAAAAATQTALQGGSQSLKAMTATFPTHTTGSTAATVADMVFKSTWGVTEGNFTWNEFGIFNKASTSNRRMVSRKVSAALLTKSSAVSATLTVTATLA